MLIHYRTIPYLNTLPNYNQTYYITGVYPILIDYELHPILIHYRTTPYFNTLPKYAVLILHRTISYPNTLPSYTLS